VPVEPVAGIRERPGPAPAFLHAEDPKAPLTTIEAKFGKHLLYLTRLKHIDTVNSSEVVLRNPVGPCGAL